MTKEINFTAVKEYLRNGTIPEENLEGVDLNQAQALFLRREAILAEEYDPEESEELREMSREFLLKTTQVADFSLLDQVMSSPEVDINSIVDFLDKLGLEKIPVLSNTPKEIRDLLSKKFTLELISPDQVGLTDFDNIISESEVPESIREMPIVRESEGNLVDSLKSRWFLFLIMLLAVFSAVGFSMDWSVGAQDLLGPFSFYFSIYGTTAVARSVWQISRAERWNKKARTLVRSEYAEILPEMEDLLPGISEHQDLLEEAKKISKKRLTWDTYKTKFGLDNNDDHEGIVGQLIERTGVDLTKDQVTDEMIKRVIEKKLGDNPPSVAVVIPTYKTTLEEMRNLLESINDIAYPVETVYLVYNDDPNDPDLSKRPAKQDEFADLQEMVDKINAVDGKNSCQIKLLAQPSRGKREAMAMGFALACGEKYTSVKHPDSEIANLIDIPGKGHDYVLNIDSDTYITDKYAILNSIILMEDDPEVAMTTGDVRVVNRDINLLAEMTGQRYKWAFFRERAAQALSGEVTCLSGPFVLMKADVLATIIDSWYYQEFLGQRSTYGDDRHLSTQALERGHKVIFSPDSAVATDCPTEWKVFLKQQLRWNKSFNRENLRLFAILQNFDKFVQLDVIYQQTFAFAMLYILGSITENAVSTGLESGLMAGLETAIPYATIVLIYNELFFGLYGYLSNDKDLKFFLSPVYIGYHFASLVWLKIYAFFKMKDTDWGTKGADQDVILEEFNKEKHDIIQEMINDLRDKV